VRGLLAPAGHAAWTGLIGAVLWRERALAGRAVVNRAVVSAFLGAVALHAAWDTLLSIQGPKVDGVEGTVPLSLAVALTSLILLIRRVREVCRTDGASDAATAGAAPDYAHAA
jgi:protease PrsW